MDEAVAKSLRRHAEKHRPPRTPEEETAYQAHRARLKMKRLIRGVLDEFWLGSESLRGNGSSLGAYSRTEGVQPVTIFTIDYPSGDDRQFSVQYLEPSALRVSYRTPLDDPIRREWDQVVEHLRAKTGLPVEVVDEPMPTEAEKAAWAAERAELAKTIKIIFKRRPGRVGPG